MVGIIRGDIYFVKAIQVIGSEQRANRPAIVISNNKCNRYSSVIEVVYLTTRKNKKELPTHVIINSCITPSMALCEQIYSVSKIRLKEKLGHLFAYELKKVNRALRISIGLD